VAAPRGTLAVDTGTGPRATPAVALRVPVDGRTMPDVSGSVGAALDPALAERLAAVLATPLPDLVVHTDAVADAAAREAGAPLAIGTHLYLGTVEATLDVLARLVAQALAGLAGPATTPPDPAAATSVSVPVTPEPPSPETAPVAPAPDVAPEPVAPDATVPTGGPAPDAAAAPADGATAGAPAETAAAPAVELLIPPAPTEPGPAQQARARAVGGAAGGAARAATTLPTAAENTGDARGAVTPPTAESVARAQADLAEALGRRPEPNPALVALCDRIRESIRAKRPVDEEHLVDAKPDEMARDSGRALNTAVESDANRVRGSYDAMGQPATPAPATPGTPVTPPPAVPATPVAADRAAPDAVPPENVSLDADRAAVDQRIADANIERPSTEPIQTPPFSDVRQGRDELGQMAGTRPAEVLARQDEALLAARGDMAALQQRALEALTRSRTQTVAGTADQQTGMVGSEQQTRESVSRQAQQIFDDAQRQVNALLEPMSRTAMATWTAGVERHSQEFKDTLAEVKRWVDERHSGVGGAILSGWDALTGLPGWVVRAYDRAERLFGDRICDLLLEISANVESIVAAAEAVIEDARTRISTLFSNLPAELQGWAAEQQAQFAQRLDGLHERVTTARDDFNRDISERAVKAVADVQHEVEALREAAGGLIGRIAAAIDAFLEDPVKAIIDGLLSLVGIPPAAFWALVARIQQVASDIADDPMNFVNNLVLAIKAGFEGFFARFPEHLMQGFFDWLFSGLGSVGVQIPADTSLPSLVTFALQLMGITWPRVREILVRHVGERNVALVEQVWQFVSTLITRGPQGIFEMIKERLDPAAFVQQIIDAAVQYVVQTLVQQVAARVIALLNPAGAVVQAIELIYRVLRWVFENAARIFKFVETVVNAMADIIAGNINGTAVAIEAALAMLLPPVIDFLAGYLGLGDLPQKVADVIKGLQDYVYGIMDAVIGWLVERGRALLQALGIGGSAGAPGSGDTELGESVPFSGGEESHRLWVDRSGDTATPMVASERRPIATQVVRWSAKLTEPNGVPADKRDRARTLLDQARAKLGILDTEVQALAPAFNAAEHGAPAAPATTAPPATGAPPAPAGPDDTNVEQHERELAPVLGELFGIFDAHGREWALGEIAQHLDKAPGPYVTRAHAFWKAEYIDPVTYTAGINQADGTPREERLWPTFSFAGTDQDALTVVGQPSAHELLLPYFLGVRRQGADTDEFRSYVFSQPSAFRPLFLSHLGPPVKDRMVAEATPKIAAVQEPEYRQPWENKLAAITYTSTVMPYGRLGIPTEHIPDHVLWRPQMISVDDLQARPGYRQTRYTTSTGQTFTVDVPVQQGQVIEIRGESLMLWQGRGRTQRSEGFVPNRGMNAAHLIANRFTGSGFTAGGNLISTSDTYNQDLMAARENDIVRHIRAFAADHGQPPESVRFEMTVKVWTGELREPTVLAEIKQQPWYAAKANANLDALVQGKLDAEIDTNLRRVTQVEWRYTLGFLGEPALESGFQRLPQVDLWFYIDY
jgi:hypothetical protein